MDNKTLEEEITSLQNKAKKGPLSLAEILQSLPEKRSSLLLIILALPFCQPLQIPGLSTPFGLVIALIGWQMIFRKPIWLPSCILKKKIASSTLEKVLQASLRFTAKIKHWIHPRLSFACTYPYRQTVNGLLIFTLGLLLALPLPIPLSNLMAAWAILCLALGLLQNDGLFVLIGYAIFFLAAIFFACILLFFIFIAS
jgi:hypothetical protein